MEDYKALFYSSRFPQAREKVPSKFIDSSGMRPQKKFASPGVRYFFENF